VSEAGRPLAERRRPLFLAVNKEHEMADLTLLSDAELIKQAEGLVPHPELCSRTELIGLVEKNAAAHPEKAAAAESGDAVPADAKVDLMRVAALIEDAKACLQSGYVKVNLAESDPAVQKAVLAGLSDEDRRRVMFSGSSPYDTR
jgi:hypothetical protein